MGKPKKEQWEEDNEQGSSITNFPKQNRNAPICQFFGKPIMVSRLDQKKIREQTKIVISSDETETEAATEPTNCFVCIYRRSTSRTEEGGTPCWEFPLPQHESTFCS